MKRNLVFKCILTGIIYAISTCIVQVPIANLIYYLLNIESDSEVDGAQLPWLLLTIFAVGTALAVFYYYFGHLFSAESKWIKGIKFSLFIYFSNYIPQVFFLDATEGVQKLLTGGFPVIQVELFDLIILLITVMSMILFMPCRYADSDMKQNIKWWKCLAAGLVFAVTLTVLNEVVLPIIGISNVAENLGVLDENKRFFYSIMFAGFWLSGILMAYMNFKAKQDSDSCFLWAFISLIWCSFDLTMIPLGFGIAATFLFVGVSIASTGIFYLVLRKI